MGEANDWKKTGYSAEELWFHRYNLRLIEKLKAGSTTIETRSPALRPKLTLIQGGGTPETAAPPTPVKKAA